MKERSEYGFWISLAISLAMHVGLVGIYYFFENVGKNRDGRFKVQAVSAAVLVRKGTPRPKEFLPRYYRKKKPKAPKKKYVTKKDQKKKVKKKKRKKNSRPIPSLEELMKEADRNSDLGEDDPRGDDLPLPGSPDGYEYGTADTAREGSLYGAKLTAIIERNMVFPEILSESQVQACRKRLQILLYIDKRGKLIPGKLKLVRKSGDSRCDNAALAAVRRAASSFPPPPDKIWPVVKNGIIIQFR